MGQLGDQQTDKSLQYWEGGLLLGISNFTFTPKGFHRFQVHLPYAFLFTCLQFHFFGVAEELTNSNDFSTSGKIQWPLENFAIVPRN